MIDLIKKNLVLFIVFIILFLFFLYQYINPFFSNISLMIMPHKITNIDYANKYYSMLSSVSGLFIGFMGLLLGAFYYINRNKIEENQKKREQQRNRLDSFMSLLKMYDEQIYDILKCNINDDKELTYHREKSQKIFDEIVLTLDQGFELIGFTDSDALIIIKINSFVEKSTLIFHCSYSDYCNYRQYELNLEYDKYYDLITKARQLCYRKIV